MLKIQKKIWSLNQSKDAFEKKTDAIPLLILSVSLSN
jgi:hypothetical protein